MFVKERQMVVKKECEKVIVRKKIEGGKKDRVVVVG
jgi:hypothetical protein